MATTTVSLAAIRRLTVSTQGYAPRFRRARAGRRRGGDPPARRGTARLDLGRRPRAPPHPVEPHRRVPRAGAAEPARPRAASSSTGRTKPASSPSSSGRTAASTWKARGTGASTRPRLTGTRTSSNRCSSGSAPRAARLARLRGRRRRHRDVELEAGEDGARGALGSGSPRRRGPDSRSSAATTSPSA